jgi:glucose-6-phosphate 1-dehydrogenase
VPFYLRTGKRMAARAAEMLVRFRTPPTSMFTVAGNTGLTPNALLITLQPDEGLKMTVMSKVPGDGMRLKPVSLSLDFSEAFKTPRMEAYERLLLDVMESRLRLFMRADELEAAWAWVDPILSAWDADEEAPRAYSAGTWGPAASSRLTARDGNLWREEL